nr:hypothetical protein [Saprospiraceae bacterium]
MTISQHILSRIAQIAAVIFLPFLLVGQTTFQPRAPVEPAIGVMYSEETVFDLFIHTSGIGAGVKFGEIEAYHRTTFYHIEFGTMKHPKEVRQSNRISLFSVLSRPYIYGKQNSLYTLRAGMGTKRYFSEKARRRGIAVGVSYQYGATLGILKPYYLELRSERDGPFGQVRSERYSENNRDRFLDRNLIEGHSGFFKGISELGFTPGVHVKGGMHFAWGAFEERVRALELGLQIDLFFSDIDIMIIEDNKPYFINLYLTLQFGKRK